MNLNIDNDQETYLKNLEEVTAALKPTTFKEKHLCNFIARWETYIPKMSNEEVYIYLNSTSPHHKSEGMRWLYDRLLGVLVERGA
ncbi:MAG: hypothetical protein EBR82_68980 [Caulobacteraceae bacterium]|nr:hypothetical protein [Caulobacteraceae bacterium]